MEFKWDGIKFEELETIVFRMALLMVRHALEGILEDMDEYLAAVRDRSRYEVRGIEERVVDTLVGSVRFRRRVYWDRKKALRVHLLDEKLGIKGYQRVSESLVKVAVSLAAAGPSYRNARDRLKELIGEEVLSHEGIRQMVLKTGAAIKKGEPEPERAKKRRGVIFIEADGVWTGRQGREARRRGRKKKEESKFCVVHEGWQVRYPGSKEYQTLTTLRYVQPKGSGEDFWEGVYRELDRLYDLERSLVVINGDKAEWIKQGVQYFPQAIYQYDRFHISREVSLALKWDEGFRKRALESLRDNDLGRLLEVLDEAIANAGPKHRRSVEKVRRSVCANWEDIMDYRIRLKALGYDTQGFRGLGSGESNIGKFKSRTRGRSWSSEGLLALGKVLFKLLDGSLGIYTAAVSSRLKERTAKVVAAGAHTLKKAVLKAAPGVKRGHFPCLDRGTEGYAELFRQILKEGFAL